MGWADWMTLKPTFEQELEVERQVREVQNCENLEVLQGLCAALTRQSHHHSQLLKQAVGRIAELDAKIACAD